MNKCPFCKQEIKEENAQVLIKINGNPQRVVGRKRIVKEYKDKSLYRNKGIRTEYIPVIEVESK